MRKEKVIIVGIKHKDITFADADFSLKELGRLVNTANGEVVGTFLQKKENITPQYLIGRGKLQEIKSYCENNESDTIVFDDSLSPAQQRNIEDFLSKKVIDRTRLILDIFSKRSVSKEGKLQVELAQLEYLKPRLTGKGIMLSQQTGGIGTKGPGERKLEVDSRRIRERIARLKKEIEKIKKTRAIQREKRKDIPAVSLVGYTNSGKSTLMNKLTDAGVFMEDKLFATLDTTTRRFKLANGQKLLLTDTVGFVQKLPHELVASFMATLEEIKEADVIVHLIDVSIKNYDAQTASVNSVLKQLGVENIPVIQVFNKADTLPDDIKNSWLKRNDIIAVSALKGIGLEKLSNEIVKVLKKKMHFVKLAIPYKNSELAGTVHEKGIVKSKYYKADKIYIEAWLDDEFFGKLKIYIQK